jgi:hypothetical protein
MMWCTACMDSGCMTADNIILSARAVAGEANGKRLEN